MSALLWKELTELEEMIIGANHPFCLLVGGDRIQTKLSIIKLLLPKVDKIVVGGLVACAFCRAQDHSKCAEIVTEEAVKLAEIVLKEATSLGIPLIISVDVLTLPKELLRQVRSSKLKKITMEHGILQSKQTENQKSNFVSNHALADQATSFLQKHSLRDIPLGWLPIDIGSETVEVFCKELRGSHTVLWTGLLGVCEVEEYAEGTREVMNYLASLCPAQAMVLVCGGHTVSMVDHSGCTECFGKVARVYDGSLLRLLEGTEPHGDTVRLPSF